jgi:hypothetical protein
MTKSAAVSSSAIHGLTWIDNLETSNGKYPLDDPRHRDYDKPYVYSPI